MSYDAAIAARLRDALMRVGPAGTIDERKMFGGITLLLDGSMACGVLGTNLVVRTGAAGAAEALALPHTRPMDFTGKPMQGFVYVAPAGFTSDAELDAWVARGIAGARSVAGRPRRKSHPSKPRRPRA